VKLYIQQEPLQSADAGGPRDGPQIRNIAFEKVCNKGLTFKASRTLKVITVAAIG